MMKVLFIYETGETEFAWLQPSRSNRWIDKTWEAIVTVEDATSTEREELLRRVSPEKLRLLLAKEIGSNKGTGALAKLEIVSVTYDDQRPDSYDSGSYLGIVVKRKR
jgi:hypothetical protein